VLGEDAAMNRGRLGVLRPAGVGQAYKDAAAIVRTQRPRGQTIALQPADHSGERALAQVHGVGELLHAVRVVVGLGQSIQHLEVADAKLVLMQFALKGAGNDGVVGKQLTPLRNE